MMCREEGTYILIARFFQELMAIEVLEMGQDRVP